MKRTLVRFLRCPYTGSRLRLRGFVRDGAEVIEGVLLAEEGKRWYPVTRGIPRMLSPDLFDRGEFVSEHRGRLEQLGIPVEAEAVEDTLTEVKQRTSESFGFEWEEYRRFGWDDPVFDLERERRVFLRKTVSTEEDWAGRLVLDAGCGNGRYSYWAAEFGAKVVAMDLSNAVDSASQNIGDLDVHLVQGDIFRPPFPADTFDVVFSIGVLMLTGDARRATLSLARLVAPVGTMSINVYGKGNPVYEFNDRLIRRFTTTMGLPSLHRFAGRMARLADFCDRHHLLNVVNGLIRLENHPHCIFDWYSPASATHHTEDEVADWFAEGGLEVLAVESGRKDSLNRMVGRILGAAAFRAGSSVRVLGRRPADGARSERGAEARGARGGG